MCRTSPIVLALVFALALLMGVPSSASSPCKPPEHLIPQMDVVVSGRVLAWPVPRLLIVEVDRYYRGEGPAILVAERPGWLDTSRYTWSWHIRNNEARPNGWIFSFHRGRADQLVNSGCDPYGPFTNQDIKRGLEGLGEGEPPEPGIGIHSHYVWDFPLKIGLLAAGFIWWRRARRKVA